MEQGTWDTTAEGFRRYLLTHGRTPDTAKTYVQHLRTFWNYRLCCSGDAAQIGREAVEDYLFDQISRVASSTAHVRLAALKAYLRWRLDLPDKAEPPVTFGLAVKKTQHQSRPPLTEVDGERLLASCRTAEQRLLFIIGFGCGLRISEILSLRAENIYPDRGLMLVLGKGKKERWVAPQPEVFRAIAHHGVARGMLFQLERLQAWKMMKRIAVRAGVEGFYPHRMRITFASKFLAETHDLHSLQILMGHSSPDVTSKYASFDAQAIALDQMRNLTFG
jgi:site-specific recombinase XerD